MEYSIFKECILEAMKERFPDDTVIEYKDVLKNNGVKLDGLLVRTEGRDISPTVYVNDYYDLLEEGEDFERICDRIEELIVNNRISPDFDPDSLIAFDNVKDKIAFKLINYSKNTELLKDVPHKKYLDLAVVYYITVNDEFIERGSILINNSHLKLWDKNEDEIDELARINAPSLFKAELKSMADTLSEFLGFEGEDEMALADCNMYVLSNDKKHFGAAVMLYDNILKEFAGKVGSDFFILPSSVHEVIMIPTEYVDEAARLDEMICEINATQVPAMDILSDHSYLYCKDKECVTY